MKILRIIENFRHKYLCPIGFHKYIQIYNLVSENTGITTKKYTCIYCGDIKIVYGRSRRRIIK